jgi:hypothetical protein
MTTSTTVVRDRAPGELVIEQLLEVHTEARPRSGFARFLGLSPLSEDSASWYQGALGEIAVGRILTRLPDGWTVFHALPIGAQNSDIDHLVVGAGGVFTINTKHHRGKTIWVADNTFMVSGQRQRHLRYAAYEADRVGRMLGKRTTTPVQPLLVLVDPKKLTIRKAPERVKVLDARQLVGWLKRRPVVLAPTDLTEIVSFLGNPTTWRHREASGPDQMVQFERLNREVRAARSRRTLWTLGLSGAAAAGLFVLAQLVPQLIEGLVSVLMQ